jgi:hypothetical protein
MLACLAACGSRSLTVFPVGTLCSMWLADQNLVSSRTNVNLVHKSRKVEADAGYPVLTTLLCFDLTEHTMLSLQSAISSSIDKANTPGPYYFFLFVLYELLSPYNDSVWLVRNYICT